MLRTAAFAAALVAFGSVLPGAVEATPAEAGHCLGQTQPLCAEITTIKCTEWYPCEFLKRCCKTESRDTQYLYWPTVE